MKIQVSLLREEPLNIKYFIALLSLFFKLEGIHTDSNLSGSVDLIILTDGLAHYLSPVD